MLSRHSFIQQKNSGQLFWQKIEGLLNFSTIGRKSRGYRTSRSVYLVVYGVERLIVVPGFPSNFRQLGLPTRKCLRIVERRIIDGSLTLY